MPIEVTSSMLGTLVGSATSNTIQQGLGLKYGNKDDFDVSELLVSMAVGPFGQKGADFVTSKFLPKVTGNGRLVSFMSTGMNKLSSKYAQKGVTHSINFVASTLGGTVSSMTNKGIDIIEELLKWDNPQHKDEKFDETFKKYE